jgi:hypothetical protein
MSRRTRKSLGKRLRRLRDDAGLRHRDLELIGSKAKLSRIESGEQSIRQIEVEAWCSICRADGSTKAALVEMSKNAHSEGWWEAFDREVMPPWFASYVEMEGEVATLKNFNPCAVHGLLQTEAYQRAIFAADQELPQVEQQVAARLRRQQEAFQRPNPLKMTTIMDEGVLKRQVGGAEVMAEQIEHLRALDSQSHIEAHVLTFGAGAHLAMRGGFTILEYEDPEDPSMTFLETDAGSRYEERVTTLERYSIMFEDVLSRSVPLSNYQE